MKNIIEKLQVYWRAGKPQRMQWTESDWEDAFKEYINSLDNLELLYDIQCALTFEDE